ncbi:MAG: hypothetical protein U9N38_03865 [Thermodesulfobacteriota bacterium]|nr:hypothetical protein [Thermodesulfobacteriota bacterium]
MIEKALENIAEKILALDEASLSGLWEKYKARLEKFDTTKEWEKAAIIFFIINSVKVKNKIFNEQITSQQKLSSLEKKMSHDTPPYLKRIK